MPYAIRKKGDKYDLVKKDTGEKVSSHDSRASAMAQMKAIYANESPKAKEVGAKWLNDSYDMPMVQAAYISPDDPRANYDPLGGNKTYACANCEFFNARSSSCQLVTGDIVPTGYCDLWTRELSADERAANYAMPVYMVEKSILGKVKEVIQDVLGLKPDPDSGFVNFTSGFKTFGPNNQYWAALYTNNAQDRDHEWFPEKAHDQFIAMLDAGTVPMPQLDYWHSKAYHGQAFWVDRIGHIMMAVGTFYDDPFSQAMKQYYSRPDADELVSHGFYFSPPEYKESAYNLYATFEISPLPPDVASNVWTGFASLKEYEDIAMDEAKKKQLEQRLGPTLAAQLLQVAGSKSAELDKVQTSFKEQGETAALAVQVKALSDKFDLLLNHLATAPASKAKKGAEGSQEEEDTESDSEAAAEGDKPKGKKKEVTQPAPASDPNLATVLTGLANAVNQINAALAPLQADVKAIKQEFANPVSATRSQHTVVQPSDPTIAALAAKMTGQGGDPTLAPGAAQQQQFGMENIADFNTVFGGTQLAALNGNRP